MIDISRTVSPDALVYPGDPPVRIHPLCRIGPASAYNLLEVRTTCHVLTHVDAPRHFFEDGAAIDELPPERFVGEALVIAVNAPAVRPEHLPAGMRGLSLLFKTRHSGPWGAEFDTTHVYVEAGAAARIAASGANLVGIDYLSVDRCGDEAYPVHRALLGAGIPILEGLDLSAAAPGKYTLIALPLRLAGADGSPARAVLVPR